MRVAFAALILLGFTTPIAAQTVQPMPSTGANRPLNDQQLLYIYRNKLKPLRAEILARTAAEGGQLSAVSQAEFQNRLDTINREFRRFAKKQDIHSFDAWGNYVIPNSPAVMKSRR